MKSACRPRSRRPVTCYDPEAVERFVAEKMTQTLTFASGACHSALVDLGKGRFAQLFTPCYVPPEMPRVFACHYGVSNGRGGVRFLRPDLGGNEEDMARAFGIQAGDLSLFNPSKPFYDAQGGVVQGKRLVEIVLRFLTMAQLSDLSRNEQGYVPARIDGVLPLSALPVAKGQGGSQFYRPPSAGLDGPT